MRIGVVSFAHPHAESYAECLKSIKGVEFCGIFDEDEERGRRKASEYGVSFHPTLGDLIKKAKPEAVIITSENARHVQHALEAMENGLHVLCEKPISTTLDDADRLVEKAEETGVVFQTCYVMRYHRAAITVKQLLDEGRIGRIRAMVGTNKLNIDRILIERWFTEPSLSGGGAIMDHTVHLADMMRWYLGREATRVYTITGRNLFDLKVEDHFLTLIDFEGDVSGTIDGSWCMPEGYPTWGEVGMTIYGEEGVIMLDAFRQNLTLITGGEKPGVTLRYYGCNPDLEMIKDFVRCVREGGTPRATVVDGRQGVEITVASYISAKTRKPVELPLKVNPP